MDRFVWFLLLYCIPFLEYLTIITKTKHKAFILNIQRVHLSAHTVLGAPLGINPQGQEGALSFIIKAFALFVWWEKAYSSTKHT